MRVSTGEQTIAAQVDALKAADCNIIFADEGVSGIATERPGLAQALVALEAGDSLVIVRFDRLARSLAHLVTVAQSLQERGVYLRSLSDAGERLGRPRALTPLQVERAKRHVERGEAVSDIARDLKVSRRTLHRALAAQRIADAA